MLKRLLVNRRLAALWVGQVVSQTGDSVYQIGLVWLMLELTGSKGLTGLVAAMLFLPTLLFGIPAGVLADRVSRRGLMIAADAARLLLVLAIPLGLAAGIESPVFLAGITFLVASFAAVFNPSRDAIVPDLVTPAQLPHANALIHTSWQVAILLGPAIAAAVLAWGTVSTLFVVDAATFALSLLAVLAIGTVAQRRQAVGTSPWQELKEGVAYAAKDPVMRLIILVTAIDNLILMGTAIIGPPVFVRDILGLGVEYYAYAEAALAGGVLVGAPFMAIVGKRLPLGKVLMVGIVLDGLTYVPIFFVNSFPALVALIFVHSFFIPLITVARATLMGRLVPPHLRGRMFAVVNVCVVGGIALSTAVTGKLAEILPIQTLFLIIGLGAAATAIPGFFSKALPRMDRVPSEGIDPSQAFAQPVTPTLTPPLDEGP